jgi:hypothetical protein
MTPTTALSARPSPLSPQFFDLLRRVVVALAILFAVFHISFVVPNQLARAGSDINLNHDVDIYYRAAVRLQQGLDVYQPWPEYTPGKIPDRFFYSPPFLLLTRPLVEFGYQGFSRIWVLLIISAYWVYAAALAKIATGKWDWKATLVFGMLISIVFHGDQALQVGQFEPFMWMMLGLALATKCRAGWLALAMLVKIHPMWVLGLALYHGKARAWKQMLWFTIPVLLASVWLVGLDNWAMWWPSTAPVASQGTFLRFNWSLSFYVLRLTHYVGWLEVSPPLPIWAKAFLSVCAVAGPVLTAFMARRTSSQMQLALVASAGVLFAPLCWMIYTPALLLPVAVWWSERYPRAEKALS